MYQIQLRKAHQLSLSCQTHQLYSLLWLYHTFFINLTDQHSTLFFAWSKQLFWKPGKKVKHRHHAALFAPTLNWRPIAMVGLSRRRPLDLGAGRNMATGGEDLFVVKDFLRIYPPFMFWDSKISLLLLKTFLCVGQIYMIC